MPKATIRMLRTERGAEYGHTVCEYQEGKQYEVEEELADAFASTKAAVVVKHVTAAPETKVAPRAERSKAR